MKSRFANLRAVLLSPHSMLIGVILGLGLWFLVEHFTKRNLINGNYGELYGMINLSADIASSILFALFTATIIYKFTMFKKVEATGHLGWIGGVLTALVGGCAGCSLTLATYVGLGSVMLLMPYGGLELKLIGVVILAFSLWKNIRDLLICKMKLK